MPELVICLDCGGMTSPASSPALCDWCRSQRAAVAPRRKRPSIERRSSPDALARRAEARRFYASGKWKRVRDAVRKRDGACQMCGTRHHLTVDHIVPRRDAPELAFAPENLRTLCRSCHGRRDGGRSILKGRGSARPVGKPSRGAYGFSTEDEMNTDRPPVVA